MWNLDADSEAKVTPDERDSFEGRFHKSDARLDRQSKAREELERLRIRLLDLSGRNRFLNFKHSETSANQLRIVNSSITTLQGAIELGQELTVRGLRKPQEVQPALDLSEDDDAGATKGGFPRHRMRRFDPSAMSDAAREQGINPDYELPLASATQKSREIQSLLFNEDLERRLQGIYDKERRSAQELGISTLYICLGFLEWYEAEHSDRRYLAPLILYPVELKRTLFGTKYRFTLRGVGEDPESNISLIERLTRDFAIRLPEFNAEDQSLADYLTIVDQAASEQKRWRVRPMVTIAILNFAKLAMYKDLDPEQRAEDSKLESNSVIVDVLAGGESSLTFSSADDEANLQTLPKVPLLVTEADSSQFGAIAEALSPRNLVIEGPPGTGKSQTITNIIAGALAKGMKVLFVAEKLAALQVVKLKIDSYGLGTYCLELHSTKARKIDVYKSIGERLFSKRPTMPNVEQILSEIGQQKRILDDYIAALHSEHGTSGETVHDLLWKEQRLRLDLGAEASNVERIHISHAEEYSPARAAAATQTLAGFEVTASGISASYGSPAQHPWFGFKEPEASLEQRRELVQSLFQEQRRIVAFLEACVSFASYASIKATDFTVGQWIDIATLACGLAEMDPGLPPSVLQRLRDDDALSILLRLIRNISDAESIEQALGNDLLHKLSSLEEQFRQLSQRFLSTLLPSQQSYAAHSSLIEVPVLGSTLTSISLGDLPTLISQLSDYAAKLRMLMEFGNSLETHVQDLTASGIALVDDARTLLEQTPRRILAQRTAELVREENADEIERICLEGEDLRSRRSTFKAAFDVAGLPEPVVLRDLARTLRDAGFLWWFNADVRDARKLYRRCSYERGTRSNDQIAVTFVSLADYQDSCQEFTSNARSKAVLGDLFQGLETDFTFVRDIINFSVKSRMLCQHRQPAGLAVRDLLLSGNLSALDAFLSAVQSPLYSQLRAYLAESSWAQMPANALQADSQREIMIELQGLAASNGIPGSLTLGELYASVDAARTYLNLRLQIDGDGAAREILREHFCGKDSDVQAIRTAHGYMSHLNAARRKLPPTVLDKMALLDKNALRTALTLLMPLWLTGAASFAQSLNRMQLEPLLDCVSFFGNGDLRQVELTLLVARLKLALDRAESLDDWARYLHLKAGALRVAGEDLITHFERGEVTNSASLPQVFSYLVVRSAVRSAIEKYPALRDFPGVSLQAARERFRDLDRRVIETQRKVLAAQLHSRPIDPGNNAGARGTWTGLALLNNEVTKQKRHIAIRDVVQRGGMALQQVMPCFMMSPLSVAQYLPPASVQFDLVVIDEASQMKPEDALGALSRGGHAIVVGDPKQLPPTSFFEREIEDEETSDEDAMDNESILLLAMSQYGKRRLRWHYRSRHESLIAFSNRHFYENDLIVFPSPATPGAEYGVRSHYIGGAYKSGANPEEARAVTDAAIRFMRESPELSLGIVAINREQRELIYDEITRAIANDKDASSYVERWESTLLPFFVKNLESVQGDERDVIFISTVYGGEEKGAAVAQRFGPILGPSGWRRLNVLFTRSRVRVEVFTSMTPSDIRVDEKSGPGVKALHDYLEYAASGRLETGTSTRRPPGSDFEIAVGRLLEAAGYEVEPQVGVSHYYIDLAVRHPRSGSFVLGIECDGATYHSAKSARDRDRTREEALRSLGWSLYRIWSTDWFADPRREFVKLEAALKQLCATA